MQSIDAIAVIMATTLLWLVIALRFVNPTQIVAYGGTACQRVFRRSLGELSAKRRNTR